MNTQVANQSICEFFVNSLLECPEKCITRTEEGITISIPEDKFTQDLTEKMRECIYGLLESEEFIEKLSMEFSNKEKINFKGSVIKDLDGFVILLKK